MKHFLQYLLLETKKVLIQLPKLFTGSILLLAVTFACIVLINTNSAELGKNKPIFIGILAEKEEPFIDWIIKTANNMPDMGYSFQIKRIDKETATKHFFDDDSNVLFIVPKNYIASIINGKNEHLTIRFSKAQTTIVNTLVKELADAASSYILDTEGAIYTMQDYYKKYGLPNESKDELFLNIQYVQEIISFTDAIVTVPPDSGQENSFFTDCLTTAMVLVPLILGFILAPVMTSEKHMKDHLIRFRLYLWKQLLIRLLVFLFTLLGILFLFAFVFLLLKYSSPKVAELFSGNTILQNRFGIFFLLFHSIPVLLFSATFTLFIYELSGDSIGGTLLLFFSTVLMALFSGLFYPISYLPEFFQKAAAWLPATYAKTYLLGLCHRELNQKCFIILCLCSGFFYLLTIWISKTRKDLNL